MLKKGIPPDRLDLFPNQLRPKHSSGWRRHPRAEFARNTAGTGNSRRSTRAR
jgi:hypothetical protein